MKYFMDKSLCLITPIDKEGSPSLFLFPKLASIFKQEVYNWKNLYINILTKYKESFKTVQTEILNKKEIDKAYKKYRNYKNKCIVEIEKLIFDIKRFILDSKYQILVSSIEYKQKENDLLLIEKLRDEIIYYYLGD